MRCFVLALTVIVAGCLSGPPADDNGAPGTNCPLAYPDGSPVSCTESYFTAESAPATPPGPQSTWICRDHNELSNGNKQQLWIKADGQVGAAWDFSASPLPSPGIILLTLYQEGQDQIILLPYQATGFAMFPKLPLANLMEIHVLAFGYTMRVNAVDPFVPEHWLPAEGNFTMLASTIGADPWIAFAYNANGTPRYFDIMELDESEAGKPIYRSTSGLTPLEDPWFYVQGAGGGTKWPARDPLQMRLNPGFCYAEDTLLIGSNGPQG